MRVSRYNEMMLGLLDTATELFCVHGEEGKEEIAKIGDTIHELEMFWNADGNLTHADWTIEFEKLCRGFAEAE